jgi:hypothetical protein
VLRFHAQKRDRRRLVKMVYFRYAPTGAYSEGVRDMKILITAGIFAILAGPVLAFQCPTDMAAIDAAIETASLTDEQLAQVKELRATGETEHEAGNHQASVDALAGAKALLGI